MCPLYFSDRADFSDRVGISDRDFGDGVDSFDSDFSERVDNSDRACAAADR
jgi:hypothetical protein